MLVILPALAEACVSIVQVLPNRQSAVQSSRVDGPSSFGIGPVGDQGQSVGMWARRKTVGRPDSPTSDLRRVPGTIPEGSESDIFMLPVDDAGRVEGASCHQSKAFGGPQPRVEDRESPIHGVCGIVTVQDQKLGSEAGTNGQEHEYSVARPEGTSSGSSLSLTPAPVGLNECGPLFSSSNSHGSE